MKLLESVVALALGLLILVGLWRGAAAARGQIAALDGWATRSDAARVVGLLLDLDAAGFVGPGRVGEAEVRAFRWWGVRCGRLEPNAVSVRWAGLRRPDPAKDSVVIIGDRGEVSVRPVARVGRAPSCPDPAALRIEWSGAFDGSPLAVRGFERGAYRLDDAFRYRRGRGGAQPLTAGVFDPDSAGLTVRAGRVDAVTGRASSRSWPW